MNKPEALLLEVRGLRVEFRVQGGVAKVINGIDFQLNRKETLGIVGESGCGKSITAMAILGMIPIPPGRIASGEIHFNGENLLLADKKRMREIRGRKITMIFQEPMTSLNPVYTAGEQIAETLRYHQKMNRKDALAQAIQMLQTVSIPSPDRVARQFPYELSGGMRQRAIIAMALACEPDLLIADEPTTALDVTVQAQIFELLKEIQANHDTAIIFITHDMAAIATMAQRVIVMYAGYKVEEGLVREILEEPLHPYTRGLMGCVPHLDIEKDQPPESLNEIPGIVPSPLTIGGSCAFAPRCKFVREICLEREPEFVLKSSSHGAACWLLGA